MPVGDIVRPVQRVEFVDRDYYPPVVVGRNVEVQAQARERIKGRS